MLLAIHWLWKQLYSETDYRLHMIKSPSPPSLPSPPRFLSPPSFQELIQLIKSTRVPVICICNDRRHPKIRSLANYCFDLRFQRPRVDQIKGAMMSVCFKEGVKMPPQALSEIIMASGQDVRQVGDPVPIIVFTFCYDI